MNIFLPGAGIHLTEEEAETLAAMKTERLKDDADASKGFVISFDDEPAKKSKPALKVRNKFDRNDVKNFLHFVQNVILQL